MSKSVRDYNWCLDGCSSQISIIACGIWLTLCNFEPYIEPVILHTNTQCELWLQMLAPFRV